MPRENRSLGQPTSLPTGLQRQYNQLKAPQRTNLTYINTFLHKMLLFINDAEVRDIICHISEAVSCLHRIQVAN